MSGHASSGLHGDALCSAQGGRLQPEALNEYVLLTTMSATAHVWSDDMGMQCHGHATQVWTSGAVLLMYCQCRCTHVEDAVKVFENVSGFNR
jgi:hypothetical protein